MVEILYSGRDTTKYKLKKLHKRIVLNRKKLLFIVVGILSLCWIFLSLGSRSSMFGGSQLTDESSSEYQQFYYQFSKLSDKDKEKLTNHLVEENNLMNKPDEDLLAIANSIIQEFRTHKGDSLDEELKSNNPSSSSGSTKATSSATHLSEEEVHNESLKTYKASFLSKILKLLMSKAPSSVLTRNINCELPADLSVNNIKENHLLTFQNLQTCFANKKIDDRVKNSNIHNNYVHQIKNLVKNIPLEKLYYNDKGVVIPAGGKNTLLAMGIVTLLRDRGSKIPIEIYIPPRYAEEFESCTLMSEIADPLKLTTCIENSADILEKVFADQESQQSYIDRSDLDDIFALLVSTHTQTLLIDPLYFPLKNIDYLFDFEKFTETGMLLWPRSLHRLTSPIFYEMVGKQPNLQKRNRHGLNDINNEFFFKPNDYDTPLADLEGSLPDKTMDSRIILVDKTTQLDTLLTSLYYQVFGHSWFNVLLEMKGNDIKFNHESYMAALYLWNKPYYLLNTINDDLSFDKKDNTGKELQFKLQYDPVTDYSNYASAQKEMASWSGADLQLDSNSFYQKFYTKKSLLFAYGIHAATFDPIEQFKHKLLTNSKGSFRYVEADIIKKQVDLELVLTKGYINLLCKNKNKVGSYAADKFSGDVEYKQFCDFTEKRLSFLKS